MISFSFLFVGKGEEEEEEEGRSQSLSLSLTPAELIPVIYSSNQQMIVVVYAFIEGLQFRG